MSGGSVKFIDNHPGPADLYQDIIDGFSQNPRSIPPKYFYDEKGSRLFDLITNTQDYYPTRSELSIFKKYKHDIVKYLHESCVLIEPGGANFAKVLNFIHELQPNIYIPIDISKQYLRTSMKELSQLIPWLNIHAICDDYSKQLVLPDQIAKQYRVLFFPGSSIGNFDLSETILFIKRVAELVGEKGQLLIGVDLKKDKSILQNAYDDSEGVTAEFNLNLLTRINNELAANFDLRCWQHASIYNADLGRVEMHLNSLCQQVVDIKDHEYYFAKDEIIHTENSYKYTVDEFIDIAAQSGFVSKKVWLDDDKLYSLHLFELDV